MFLEAPTFEPAVMYFRWRLTGSVFALTQTSVATPSSSDDCTDSLAPRSRATTCSSWCLVQEKCFTLHGLYASRLDSVSFFFFSRQHVRSDVAPRESSTPDFLYDSLSIGGSHEDSDLQCGLGCCFRKDRRLQLRGVLHRWWRFPVQWQGGGGNHLSFCLRLRRYTQGTQPTIRPVGGHTGVVFNF